MNQAPIHGVPAACRHFVRDHQKAEVTQVELFLNQVKLLVNLSQDEKMRLLDALEEVTYPPGNPVIKQVPATLHPTPPCHAISHTAAVNPIHARSSCSFDFAWRCSAKQPCRSSAAVCVLAGSVQQINHLVSAVLLQGEAGDYFYIIKAGEAEVFQTVDGGPKKVNHLFKADYFGEQALLTSAPRCEISQIKS